MKRIKEMIYIVPVCVVSLAVIVGAKNNIPQFPDIIFPREVVTENATKQEVADSSRKTDAEKERVTEVVKAANVKYGGSNKWSDGEYTGKGTGFGGEIEVKLTIREGKIANIVITKHDGETPEYFEKAKSIMSQIIKAQTPDVDVVSGATYTSNGIKAAVMQALYKAEGKEDIEEKTSSEKNTNNTDDGKQNKNNDKTSGIPADGTYEGSAVCEQFLYTINLKVKFKKGKAVSISGLKITDNYDDANEYYWKKAWRPTIKKILKKQTGDVDVVSGATYSSNAIISAYADAYKKAVSANSGKKSKQEETTKEKETGNIIEDEAYTEPTGVAKDGVYHVSAECEPDTLKAFEKYVMSGDVTFKDGKLISMDNFTSTDETNRSYYIRAAEGGKNVTGVVNQLITNQSVKGINAVTGATCSSKTIVSLYLQALMLATGESQTEAVEVIEVTKSQEVTTKQSTENPEETINPLLIKDGTYTVTVKVVADEWEEFMDYDMTADVSFEGGKLIKIENIEISDSINIGYCNMAANGIGSKQGIINQLIEKQSSNVDIVSGATCSSNAFINLYEEALKKAMENE